MSPGKTFLYVHAPLRFHLLLVALTLVLCKLLHSSPQMWHLVVFHATLLYAVENILDSCN